MKKDKKEVFIIIRATVTEKAALLKEAADNGFQDLSKYIRSKLYEEK